ncbi:serine/arginine repetitive matrix protein 2-like [Pristis pectinata]|uniref:serine/arginine repetitive matrix protein 2-like n=1 Tax=Pristis pectinata TaxID=685728 RepID=UPI00223DDD4C|nr:serine/arginine repetitive matrix protein 2-like [Pristis pectinata]
MDGRNSGKIEASGYSQSRQSPSPGTVGAENPHHWVQSEQTSPITRYSQSRGPPSPGTVRADNPHHQVQSEQRTPITRYSRSRQPPSPDTVEAENHHHWVQSEQTSPGTVGADNPHHRVRSEQRTPITGYSRSRQPPSPGTVGADTSIPRGTPFRQMRQFSTSPQAHGEHHLTDGRRPSRRHPEHSDSQGPVNLTPGTRAQVQCHQRCFGQRAQIVNIEWF